MSDVWSCHEQAMEFAEKADSARRRGDQVESIALFKKAYQLERTAADDVIRQGGVEPSRSILLRSAAWLALGCNEFREAERLAAIGLAGDPPSDVADELRDVLEQVHFSRHLDIRGMELGPEELQISLSGPAVGFGFVESSEFLDRAKVLERLLVRSAERMQERPFREAGRDSLRDFEVLFSAPMAASYAITVRVGRTSSKQLQLPTLTSHADVVEEVIECLDLFSVGNATELSRRIPTDTYYNNFVGLSRKLLPDGKRISQVGVTGGGKSNRRISLRESTTAAWAKQREPRAKYAKFEGRLLAANALSERALSSFCIEDSNGRPTTIRAQAGLVGDIIGPLWGQQVVVLARRRGDEYHLESIDPANENDEPNAHSLEKPI